MTSTKRDAVASLIAAMWIGLIFGVSFYAASIKFTAAGVPREQLLAVGQVTFQGFMWIELAAFVLLVIALLNQLNRKVVISIAGLFLLLLVQKLYVQPILDADLIRSIAGEQVDTEVLHYVYGAIDCAKIAILSALSLRLRAENRAEQGQGATT
jgi:hypothetical protein